MSSSDDEGETSPDAVSDYYFFDGEDELLSFSKLAVQWNESERECSSATTGPIFLRGTADNGLQKVCQQVKAWKYDLSKANPEIYVLSKDNNWIKLQKPRKSFENEIRTILITLHCLSFCKSKPEASGKSLWDHLLKIFSLYDVRPSENDLIDHMNFIRESVKRDETLAKSKFLAAFLENPRKRKFPEDAETAMKPSFIVDDTHDDQQDDDFVTKQEDSESDEEEDHFDSVCAICDNGGNLTCCEGKCFRSFHGTVDSEEAEESRCESLGLHPEVLKGPQQFRCENCLYSRHQCFVCGKLGSSDKSSVAEVFRCSAATCGHFYHPRCVAKLLQRDAEDETQDLEKKISVGEPFICPAHKCTVCKQTETEKVIDLQFAICRRCPRSYHRKCLPRKILFDYQVGDDDDIARAWDGLLPKSRALIYCLDHEIDPEFGTPARNLKFRDILHSKREQPSGRLSNKKKFAVKERDTDTNPEYTSKKKPVLKSQKGVKESSAVKLGDSSKKRVASSSGPESLKKRKVEDASKKSLKTSSSIKVKTPSSNNNQPSLGSRLFDYMHKGTESNNLEKGDTSVGGEKQTMVAKSLHQEILPPIDAKSKRRIVALMKDVASSITLDEVKRYHKGKVPSTHAHSSRVDKSIILARVEGSVEALHVALKKLEEGCSVEDAMAVCDPGVIDQIIKWKEKLRVYLSPFLHGMRYTSFGRHFTKVEKLEKIVDKLQWYIEDGDMVVDFCCGANDFSCLVKKQLDEMGKKKCSYKNYDITRPKNDFHFEKRDWMTVSPQELPTGSRLIMGLNPPFGINATLANQFIAKALAFKPKLLVLIVPPETERLDGEKKKIPYDLVWEDVELLAGKSFYLPGSFDVNDKQMDQWNNTPPPLYLWSRPDWTSKHKAIAQERGHISKVREAPHFDETLSASDRLNETNDIEDDHPVLLDDLPVIINKEPELTTDKAKSDTKRSKNEGPDGGTETKNKHIVIEKSSNQTSSKRSRNQNFQVKEHGDKSAPAPSHQDHAQKPDDKHFLAPDRRDQAKKLDNKISLAHSDQDRGRKYNNKRSLNPSYQDQYQKLDDEHSLAPSYQDQYQKLDDEHSLAPSYQDRYQKLSDKHSDQKLSDKHSLTPYHEDHYPKLDDEHSLPPSHQDQYHKLDDKRSSLTPYRHDQYQKLDGEHSLGLSHQDQYQKLDDKLSLVPSRQDQASETLPSDLSFWNDIEPSFDQQLERRYNFNAEESNFSYRNDVGQSFDQHLERRYNSNLEDSYMGTPYRQLDGPNLSTPSYPMRSDQVPHSTYDRVGRGSYIDEMSGRGGYPMSQHEPGLTRYSPADIAPYNRTSTSTMQRYAPRLDELNHTRMNNLGRSEPPMANRGMGGYGQPMPGPGFHMDSMGFAPRPYHPYSHPNSSGGWLNE